MNTNNLYSLTISYANTKKILKVLWVFQLSLLFFQLSDFEILAFFT
jgi:hypothetical protein